MQKYIVTGIAGFLSGIAAWAVFKRKDKVHSFWDDIPTGPSTIHSINIALDFDVMVSLFEKYGENGVYAYLIDNYIAKDERHGNFIIKQLFMPEYEKYKRRASKTSPPLPMSDFAASESEETEPE